MRHELESRRQMAYIDFGQNLQEREFEDEQAHLRIQFYPKRHRELIKRYASLPDLDEAERFADMDGKTKLNQEHFE